MGEQNPSVSIENLAANDTGDFSVAGDTSGVSFADPVLTINGGSPTISMATEGASTSQRIEVTDAATVTLNGVTIDDSTDGPAITISSNQDVTLLLADRSKNVLNGNAGNFGLGTSGAPGIQKTDAASGWLIIGIPENSEGTGELEATGGYQAAGIGGGAGEAGTDITISGGKVTATGGDLAAGIGGGGTSHSGDDGSGSEINISGGTVTATGGFNAAGIGGAIMADGNNITISGGTVTATGGYDAAGIGAGKSGSADNNSIAGDNVVVKAESGDGRDVDALEGFSTINKGLIFRKGQETSNVWSGDLYTSATINGDFEIPCNFTIAAAQKLTVGANATLTLASGAILTVSDGAELANEGTISDVTEANITNNGKITTKANFYLKETDKTPYTSQYQTYKTGKTVGTYTNLPNPDVEAKRISDIRVDIFSNWYYLDGEEKVAIKDGDNVLLNQHTFYEETVPAPDPGPEPEPTDTVTLTFRTDEGSWNGITETTLTGAPDAVIIPPSYPYTDATRTCIGWFDEAGKEIVSGVTKFSEVTGTVTARFVDTPGWHQNNTGWWYVYDLNNNYYTNCWALINNAWFYFNDAGYCLEYTWGYIGGEWYFFGWGGYMQTGWQWLGGYWYFLDRYTGAMKCSWVHDGVWYYCDAALGGAMYDNCWAYIDGYWYGFNEGGSMTQGWSYSYAYDGWFYLDPETGHMLYGWQYIGGHWYYFFDNGLMAANTYVGNYWLGSDGAMW